jgi:hypothetical protein
MLRLIDRSNFQEKKRLFSGGITLPVDGIPIEGFANYESFDQARSREYARQSFELDTNESVNYVTQFVPPEAFNAYTDCLRANGLRNYGLHLIPVEVSDEFVGIDLFWNSAPPVSDAALTFEISGGQFTQATPSSLPPSSYRAVNITRNEGEPLRVTVSANGYRPERLSVPAPTLAEIPEQNRWEVSGYRPRLDIVAHVQTAGDISGREGRWVGTRGQGRRLEGFQIDLAEDIPGLELEYTCHIQGSGDTGWMRSGNFCGTRGEGRRLEGLAIRPTEEGRQFWSVTYRCHLQGHGDSAEKSNGDYCGTRGEQRRLEAFTVVVTRK